MRRCLVAGLAAAAWFGLGTECHAGPEPARSALVVAGLPAADISAIVRSSGFAPTGRPVRRPGVYVVRARDPAGRAVDLTLAARTGRIVAVRPAGAARPPSIRGVPEPTPRRGVVFGLVTGPHDDPIGFEDATGALPPPPRGIPITRPAGVVRSAVVLPLPRPRPFVVAAPAAPAVPPVPPTTMPAMPPVMPLE